MEARNFDVVTGARKGFRRRSFGFDEPEPARGLATNIEGPKMDIIITRDRLILGRPSALSSTI